MVGRPGAGPTTVDRCEGASGAVAVAMAVAAAAAAPTGFQQFLSPPVTNDPHYGGVRTKCVRNRGKDVDMLIILINIKTMDYDNGRNYVEPNDVVAGRHCGRGDGDRTRRGVYLRGKSSSSAIDPG